ncbi:Bro-N domain-containing protein [Clostridium perfringens]|uniref:BRO-N domain-containing protein n=1 Tax=Clostridium perfringens TaxID=1502 RepID=UPI0039E95979
MNNLMIFQERQVLGKDFKIYGTKENPLFLAKDVAEWIDYEVSNVSKMVKRVDEDEKIITRTNNTSATFLTEDGLYEVLMQSRKPIAKQFKKEVKKILKQIRTTGGAVKDEEEFIKNYFPSFSEEVKQAMVLDLKHQNEKIQKELEEKIDS